MSSKEFRPHRLDAIRPALESEPILIETDVAAALSLFASLTSALLPTGQKEQYIAREAANRHMKVITEGKVEDIRTELKENY